MPEPPARSKTVSVIRAGSANRAGLMSSTRTSVSGLEMPNFSASAADERGVAIESACAIDVTVPPISPPTLLESRSSSCASASRRRCSSSVVSVALSPPPALPLAPVAAFCILALR
jgi:hypothetical protein